MGELEDNMGNKTLVGNHYFAPSIPKEEYLVYFEELNNKLTNTTSNIVIMGDFNVPGIDWDLYITKDCNSGVKPKAEALLHFVLSQNLHQ